MFQHKAFRYTLFGALYFAQGAILSYFTALNALYLLAHGRTMSDVGIFSAIALTPFIIKIFLGMVSDKVNLLGRGHRQPYIVLGVLTQAVCLFIVPFIHPGTQLEWLALLAFILMTGMALYDTCTDGLALDTTPPAEQGTIQGIMVAGRALGIVGISVIIGLVAQRVSWLAAFWLLGALTLVPLALVLFVREPARVPGRAFQWSAFRAFGHWPVLALGLLGALYSLIINGANELVNPFLQAEYQIDLTAAGFYTTLWGLGVVLGGLAGGPLTDRLGRWRSVLVALGVTLVATLALAAITGPVLAYLVVFAFGVAFGYYETVYFATSMEFTDPRIAASMFAILMAVANVGTGIGLGVSGLLADSLGYRLAFVVIALLNLLALPLLPVIFRPKSVAEGGAAS